MPKKPQETSKTPQETWLDLLLIFSFCKNPGVWGWRWMKIFVFLSFLFVKGSSPPAHWTKVLAEMRGTCEFLLAKKMRTSDEPNRSV